MQAQGLPRLAGESPRLIVGGAQLLAQDGATTGTIMRNGKIDATHAGDGIRRFG
jgi:hypothetical protein